MKLPKKFKVRKPVTDSDPEPLLIDDDPAPKTAVVAPARPVVRQRVSMPRLRVDAAGRLRFPRYRQGEFLQGCRYVYYCGFFDEALISNEDYDKFKAHYLKHKIYEKRGEHRGYLLLGPASNRVCDYLPRERDLALYFMAAFPSDKNFYRERMKKEKQAAREGAAKINARRQNGVKPSPPDNWDE